MTTGRCKTNQRPFGGTVARLPCARVHIRENTTFQMTNPPLILAALAREESAREEHRTHPPSERSTNPPRASVMSERLDGKKTGLFPPPHHPRGEEAGAGRSESAVTAIWCARRGDRTQPSRPTGEQNAVRAPPELLGTSRPPNSMWVLLF